MSQLQPPQHGQGDGPKRSSVFERRVAFKPFEYPEVTAFASAIRHSYWVHTEWNFLGDIQDFHTKLDPAERSAIKNALLAISQIEVSVKRFWSDLGKRLPKPEFDQVGITFGESEVRHADAYSHLLQVLELNDDFEQVLQVPAIGRRVEYLRSAMTGAATGDADDYALSLTLFSIFIENVSLFSQFAVIKSFNRHRNALKDIDNVIQATAKEETLHAMFGALLVKLIREEHPDWFGADFTARINVAADKAYRAECGIIDWIFEAGELPFLTASTLKDYVKHRLNLGLVMVGEKPYFEIDDNAITSLRWFDDELAAEVNTDFFHKKPTTYSKKMQSFNPEDLF